MPYQRDYTKNGMNQIISFFLVFFILFSSCRQISEQKQEETPDPAPSRGSIKIDGTKLNYVIEGEGTPCLVIGSSIYYPRTFSEELRNSFRMYFVDLRWFAKEYSPVDPETYSIQTIADDIDKIRSELKLDGVILIGHSIHGTIAFEYARRYPENASHVILIGSPNIFGNKTYESAAEAIWETASEERQKIQKRKWQEMVNQEQLSGAERFIETYVSMGPMYWYDPEYDARWLWEDMTVNTDLSSYLFGTIFSDYNMFSSNQTVTAPTLVLLGKYDYIIPYTLWDGLDSIPDLTIRIFDKSGHTPQLEESERFDKILLDWINNQ